VRWLVERARRCRIPVVCVCVCVCVCECAGVYVVCVCVCVCLCVRVFVDLFVYMSVWSSCAGRERETVRDTHGECTFNVQEYVCVFMSLSMSVHAHVYLYVNVCFMSAGNVHANTNQTLLQQCTQQLSDFLHCHTSRLRLALVHIPYLSANHASTFSTCVQCMIPHSLPECSSCLHTRVSASSSRRTWPSPCPVTLQ
jgi:hypothetical protein